MHTNQSITKTAREFRKRVKGELAARGWTVIRLARQTGFSRNAVSRAINRSEFPRVRAAIRKELAC